MGQVMTIGLDIAKSVFQVHGVDALGEAVLKRRLTRARVLPSSECPGARYRSARHGKRTRDRRRPAPHWHSGRRAVVASALVASVADPFAFRNGGNLAAWIGLVPKQNSSGGKERLGGITKQGNRYLR